jgi:hypothetical protein
MPIFDCEIEDVGKNTVYPTDSRLEEIKKNYSKDGWVFKKKLEGSGASPTMYEFTKGERSRFIWYGFAGLNDYTV